MNEHTYLSPQRVWKAASATGSLPQFLRLAPRVAVELQVPICWCTAYRHFRDIGQGLG